MKIILLQIGAVVVARQPLNDSPQDTDIVPKFDESSVLEQDLLLRDDNLSILDQDRLLNRPEHLEQAKFLLDNLKMNYNLNGTENNMIVTLNEDLDKQMNLQMTDKADIRHTQKLLDDTEVLVKKVKERHDALTPLPPKDYRPETQKHLEQALKLIHSLKKKYNLNENEKNMIITLDSELGRQVVYVMIKIDMISYTEKLLHDTEVLVNKVKDRHGALKSWEGLDKTFQSHEMVKYYQ